MDDAQFTEFTQLLECLFRTATETLAEAIQANVGTKLENIHSQLEVLAEVAVEEAARD